MMKSSKRLAMYILMFDMFITFSAIGLIVPVMPAYLKTFGAAGQVLGFIIAVIAFAQFIFSPVAGNLSDRHGRKNLIIIGLLVNGLSQIGFGLSTELWMLFVCRFFTGVGSAFIVPPIMAYAADITTNAERGKAMGWIGAAISLGFMIGPGIGGFLSNVSLHFPFYFGGSATIIAGILSFIILPSIKPVINEQVEGENLFQQMARSFKTKYFVLLIVVFVFSFGIANFQSTLTMFLTYKFNYTPNDLAIVMTVGGFIGVVVQGFALNKLFNMFGEMKIILFGLLVASISLYGMLYISGFFIILLFASIFSTATTLIRPAVNTLISKTAGDEQGYAAGMNNSYMSLGNMIGPALAGTLFDWHMSLPFTIGAIILLGCFVLTFVWTRRKHGDRSFARMSK
ncbi:MFS transporter [Bacillus sp. EB106-08-02-XG196]|jgi:MFS transporter, DHA1 family, multidrug resistance protein|uniref:MFS transporter n=1 Tax=Bacillus sp. EB106-08-02-XG196 TaxID=2737049 RepID=UPI0015C45DAD|nr:MFS transporter [Bacillus sp. EB106-08-02-XG196]NWQ44568.1 MFS transporter [Bacillus sp. EB106-08-02-XG196]